MKRRRNISIKTKLLGIIIPVVIAIVVVLVLVAYEMSSGIIENYSESLLESSVVNQANEIEAWLEQNIASFQSAKRTIEKINPNDSELQNMLDGYYGFNDNYPDGIYIADSSGKFMKALESKKTESDVTQSVWYKEGLTRINMKVGSAYKNSEGINVISASAMLNDGSDKVRVISADMTLDRITIIVNAFIEMNKAESVLVDKNTGVIIANRDNNLISQKIGDGNQSEYYKKLAKNITAKKYDSTTIDGEMTVFKEVDGTDWLLVSYVPISTVYTGINTVRTAMAVIGIISLFVLAVIIERTVHIVIKPVKELTRVITAMTDGDFTVSVNVKSKDEIGVMSQSVQRFIQSMRGMISSIHGVSDKLHEQADNSSLISGQMYDASRTQSQSMRELNNTVEQLSLSVNEIAENATTLAMVVADTREEGEQVDLKMKDTVEVSRQGKTDMQNVGDAMQSINQSVLKLQQAIDKVGKASEEITNITGVISGIAEETNLLSLNASIEAARAGEAGKGFAVVATEIGQLAKNSAESVQNIENLISEINALVKDAVLQADDSVENINSSSELVGDALKTFDVIFDNIDVVSTLVRQMIEKVEKVDEVASNVAAISEEQAASSEEILATSDNMVEHANSITGNSETVASDAKELTNSAEELANQVDAFKVEKEGY